MASVIFNSAMNDTVSGQIDFSADLFKVLLVSDAYKPDKEMHSKRDDIGGAEASGQGYQAGGNRVSVKIKNDVQNDRIDISLGGTSWEGSTIDARGAVYYKSRGAAGSDELIAYIDFGRDIISTNGKFQLTPSILRIQN